MRDKPSIMPASETTPLLVVQIAPRRQRYPHYELRRACTIVLAIVLSVALVLFLIPFTLLPGHRRFLWAHRTWGNPLPHPAWPNSQSFSYNSLQHILQTTPTEAKAKEWSRYYTAGPHLAGKNFSQALWTETLWKNFGIPETNIVTYDVYINYPLDHRLALLETSGGDTAVRYEVNLEEDVLRDDSTSGLPNRIPTFHGYSASGNVTAQFVYANFGTCSDFDDLIKANISLEGKIALVKYGHIFRGLKVKRAQDLGMVGVVIYTDPQEDGEITEENGYKPYPEGPARNPSAVQRGSVQFLSWLTFVSV
jgi:N-acetylated-alpha-linked acidic dipeptidase